MLGVMRLAAAALLECDVAAPQQFKEALQKLQPSPSPFDAYAELTAFDQFREQAVQIRSAGQFDPGSPRGIVIRLGDVIWHRVGVHYWFEARARKRLKPRIATVRTSATIKQNRVAAGLITGC
jgi:hypothetical protein